MNKCLKKVVLLLSPFVSVFINVLLIVLLQFLRVNYAVHYIFLVLGLVPILFVEFKFIRIKRTFSNGLLNFMFHWSGVIFWVLLFVFYVIAIPIANSTETVKLINYAIGPTLTLVAVGETYLTIISILLVLFVYYVISVRKEILKIFTVLIFPAVLSFLLFLHFYYLGGTNIHISRASIESQQGVEIIFGRDDFPKEDFRHHSAWFEIESKYPRAVFMDKSRNKLICSYSKTYGKGAATKAPRILTIDLDSKEVGYFVSYYVRAISMSEDKIYISPWFEKKIFELNKNTLDLSRAFPAQLDIKHWESVNMLCDGNGNLFISNEMEPYLLKYDISTAKLLSYLQPEEIQYGGLLWNLQLSKKTGLLYATAALSSTDIYEIDPENMTILRTLDLGLFNIRSLGASALTLDDSTNKLYVQDGGSSDIYEVDIVSFKVIRKLKGAVYARKLLVDKSKNYLYVLDYILGKLFAIDLKSGRRVWARRIGVRASDMTMSGEFLYINSSIGIVKIDLN